MLLPTALVMLRDGVLDCREPIASRLTTGLTLAVIAFTFDDLIPREIRTSSLAIMSLMTVAVVALWLLIVARLLRRSALRHDCSGADGQSRRHPENARPGWGTRPNTPSKVSSSSR